MEAPVAGLFPSLPEEHQDEILRRLPLPDAVRTSALSRAWRRRWESVPGLALSFPDGTPPGVVDGVLLCHTGGAVSSFSFVVDNASASHAGRWLVALSRRGVQSIDLRRPPQTAALSSSQVPPPSSTHPSSPAPTSCPSIFRSSAFHPSPWDSPASLCSRTYTSVRSSCHLTGRANCRLLSTGHPCFGSFTSSMCKTPVGGCVIQAPNLHSLTFISRDNEGWRFGELPCLNACICCVSEYDEDEQDFGELPARVAQVKELTLHSPWCTECENGVNVHMAPFTFYNLKSLELSIAFDCMSQMLVMFSLLKSSPNLDKLKVQFREYEEEFEHGELLSAQWTNGMCSNLQDVEIIRYV
ncbi:unnamed protein product [Urochloa decumbens]|uniref:F-box domain-containing protein n=1 Tax=Urochloa decumbens TaxID=240449 RepID=A0ABC9D2E3_9POAL